MKLIIASNNKGKVSEIKELLRGRFHPILSLEEAGIDCDPEENGATFLENVLIKVNTIAEYVSDCAILGDDSGLCIDALGGAPGLYSARFAGNHDTMANRKKVLKEMRGKKNRNAYHIAVVALRYPNGEIITAEGRTYGSILQEPQGENGFSYDPIFYSTDLGKTFAQSTQKEKNSVSHRGRAIKELLKKLK